VSVKRLHVLKMVGGKQPATLRLFLDGVEITGVRTLTTNGPDGDTSRILDPLRRPLPARQTQGRANALDELEHSDVSMF
jgi:hypothetical protein